MRITGARWEMVQLVVRILAFVNHVVVKDGAISTAKAAKSASPTPGPVRRRQCRADEVKTVYPRCPPSS